MSSNKKIILVTGANFGMGYACCKALAKQPNHHIIVAGRNPSRVNDAVATLRGQAVPSSIVESGIVDLADLASVREFADTIRDRGLQLFSLVCNAAVQVMHKTLTVDGFESTMGVNYVGHFLLVELLRDCTKRVVIVSSEVHDPAEKCGSPLPNVSDLDALVRGYEAFHGMEAYCTSKLCNLVHAKELARRFPAGPEVVAYTPGVMLDTGLFRAYPRILFWVLSPVVNLYTRLRGNRLSSGEYSGGWVARAASDPLAGMGWNSGDYIRVDEVYPASAQACDPELAAELWAKSEQWVKPYMG